MSAKDELFGVRVWLNKRALDTMLIRNRQYATAEEPIRNYVVAAEVAGIATAKAVLARTAEKLVRLGQALERDDREVVAEECAEVMNMVGIVAYAAGVREPREET